MFLLMMLAIAGGVMTTDDSSRFHARLSQVALTVSNLIVAKQFYSETLRLPIRYELPTMLIYELDGATLMLSLPEEEVPHTPHGAVVYLEVDDILRTHEVMAKRGVQFVDEPHVVHREGNRELWMAFFRDPDQHLVALMSWRPAE